MSLKIGIVGLPNVGKSTLFNALTQKKVDISNYPFCTIEPNVGIVQVPDMRLQRLAELSRSQKIIPTVVEFVDIAGLVKGAAGGEGLGNKFLSHIKDVDAIAEVVRVFEQEDIAHVAGALNPISDMEVVAYELIIKDLETVSHRLTSLKSDIKSGKQSAREENAILETIKEKLSRGQRAGVIASEKISATLQLLTAKPFFYIFNISETDLENHWSPPARVQEALGSTPFVVISAKIESELNSMEEYDQNSLREFFGIKETGLTRLIRLGYQILGLITFFTTGEKETRAWTIPFGSPAPRAGRAIHSDFEERFIRAEVINWKKLIEATSWSKARELGWLRTEGKQYIVQDGDVIEFRI